jgi:hypothetical protein
LDMKSLNLIQPITKTQGQTSYPYNREAGDLKQQAP